MLIWLASYPRSGNTFFRQIALVRYSITSYSNHLPSSEAVHALARVRLEDLVNAPEPVMVKTHNLPSGDCNPAIYLVRDGRDVLVSYAHFALAHNRKLASQAVTPELYRNTLRDLILEERSTYGTWTQNVRAWMNRARTVVVRFEELVCEPDRELDRAVAAVGCSLGISSHVLPTFAEMKNSHPSLVRRGIVGSWKDEFPPELLPLFWKKHGETMRMCGYIDRDSRAVA